VIRLYDYWRSSACYRVRIALGLANLEWTPVSVNLLEQAQRNPEHLARNPQGLVPVLEIDGLRLTQSLAIVEYLDETRGLGLLPEDPAERSRVRALAHSIAMEIHPICNLGVSEYVVRASGGAIDMQGWMQRFIAPGLAAFEEMLADGDHCHREYVTLADICLMPQLYNARRWNVDLEPMPKIRRIEDTLKAIPAFANAHPDRTPR